MVDASDMAHRLWAWFQVELETRRCPCGCSWDGTLWEHRDDPDALMFDHLDMDTLDPTPVTRAENHFRHFCRWGHDGANPYGGKREALPTWKGRHDAVRASWTAIGCYSPVTRGGDGV